MTMVQMVVRIEVLTTVEEETGLCGTTELQYATYSRVFVRCSSSARVFVHALVACMALHTSCMRVMAWSLDCLNKTSCACVVFL